MNRIQWKAFLLAALGSMLMSKAALGQGIDLAGEAACRTLQPASTGGPLPVNPDVLVLRSLGRANYEVAYRGRVLLFDTYYDDLRLPYTEPFGIKGADVTRADAIFVGHTHFDHFGSAPGIVQRTGAPVFIGPPGRKYLRDLGVADDKIRVVRGGETIRRDGYTIQTALAIHMPVDTAEATAFHDLMAKSEPLTEQERQQLAEWRKGDSDGTRLAFAEDPTDPEQDTWHHGTIVYVLTFDSGFRLLFSDTAGVLSGGERVLADSIHAGGGKIDLAILGYLQLGFSLPKAIKVTGTRARVWDPAIFIPSHFHDGEKAELPEMPTEPLFEAFRAIAPNVHGIEPLYRSPVCVNTKTDEFFVGNFVR